VCSEKKGRFYHSFLFFSARLPTEPHKPYLNTVATATKQKWVKNMPKNSMREVADLAKQIENLTDNGIIVLNGFLKRYKVVQKD